MVAFGTLLAVGLVGLAAAAVGIAHQLLPRRFTAAQQSEISAWEVQRRWRALPAGTIFPAVVSYELSPGSLGNVGSLKLTATRLGIGTQSGCAASLSGSAVHIMGEQGCTAMLRATYVDSSGSMVATIAVAVMPDTAKATSAVRDLTAGGSQQPANVVRTFRVARTAAARFGAGQRQLTSVTSAGPYVIMSTAGFADGRHRVSMTADSYLDQEMSSLVSGLVGAAQRALGSPPRVPSCPGAPGC